MPRFGTLSALFMICLTGCIDGTATNEGDADAGLAPGECRTDDDCDGWCVGPAGCDVPWQCVDEIPCSAASPFLACDCSGIIYRAAPGCPERPYGWRDPADGVMEGDACDPNDREAMGGS